MVLKVIMAIQDLKEPQDHRVQQVLKEPQGHRGKQVREVHKEIQVHKEI